MMSPSDEERIVAMVDSFTKTVARNFSRNLKRAKANAEKHYSDEPVDYLLETLSHDDSIRPTILCFMRTSYPAWFTAKLYIKHSAPCRRSNGRSYCLTSGMLGRMGKLQQGWR